MTIGLIMLPIIMFYMLTHTFSAIFLLTNDYSLIVYPDEFYWETNLNWFGVICIYILYCILCPIYALGTLLHWIATK